MYNINRYLQTNLDTGTIKPNTLYAVPIAFNDGDSITQIIAQFGYGNVEIGIYEDVSGYPGNRLCTFGTPTKIDDTNYYTTGLPLSLDRGFYWIVCKSDTETNFLSYKTSVNDFVLPSLSSTSNVHGRGLYLNYTGVLPITFPVGGLIIPIKEFIPFIGIKISGFNGTGSSGTGSSGYSGYSGQDGLSGYSGYSGYSGFSGYSGYSGYSGISGTDGFSGYSGISGTNGLSGYSGYSGFSGISGYSGFSGPGLTGLTNNYLPKATSASTLGNSRISDDGTTITIPGNLKYTATGGYHQLLRDADGTGTIEWFTPTYLIQNGNTFGGHVIAGTADNNDFYFITNSVSRMKLDTSGNLGIGLLSPTSRLQVKGFGNTNATTVVNIQNSSSIDLLTIKDDGDTTIGLNNLTVNSTSPYEGITLYKSSNGGGLVIKTTYPYIDLRRSGVTQMFLGAPGDGYQVLEFKDFLGFRNQSGATFANFNSATGDVVFEKLTSTPTTASAKVHIKGNDTTSSNYSLKVFNTTAEMLSLRNDGLATLTGILRYVDGTEGSGKVLTSDATGVASWQDPTGGSGGVPLSNVMALVSLRI